MKRKLLLAAMMLSMGLSLSAESGTCGKNLTWDLTDGVLTISGTGEMWDYSFDDMGVVYTPWISSCSSVTSVVIGNSVTSIGNFALYGCSNLTSVTIPNSVTSIGHYAFYGCCSLTSVTIPNSVTNIGDKAFNLVPNIVYTGSATGSPCVARSVNGYVDGYLVYRDASKTELLACSAAATGEIIIPNSVTSIGEYAFTGCSKLTSATIPNSVTSIGHNAFYNVPNIVYNGSKTGSPWGARSVNGFVDGYWVYRDASKAELLACSAVAIGEITIPNSVTSIGIYAFYNCSSLTSVTIPNSVTSIGEMAFEGCSNMTSVTIGNSVTSIGKMAFYRCDNLTSVTIGNSVTSIGDYAFDGCSRLISVIIGNSVTNIGYRAFAECSSLTSVTIPNSVTSIGERSFASCSSLKDVVLGASVKVLEEGAFSYCRSIETITCYSMRPPTVKDRALKDVPYTTIVYVAADAYDTYNMHDFWGLYDVRPIGAVATETEEVKVTPTETTADVAWPAVTSAVTYELVIKDKNGNVICTLVFDDKGRLTSIAFNAPARDNAPQQTEAAGFSFTVTGLEQGTTYNYTLTAKDSGGKVIDTQTGSFKTIGGTAVEEVSASGESVRKVMKDGVMYMVMPDGRMYDLQGKEVR